MELDQAHEYPEGILAALGDRRLTGLTFPEEYGGLGEGLVELVLLTEERAGANDREMETTAKPDGWVLEGHNRG